MVEKYLSGVTHPSEVMEMFRKLDVCDKEKFIDELLDDEDVVDYVRETIFLYDD